MREALLPSRDFARVAFLALAALGAGLLNGFFGTGGGMLLVIALSRLLCDGRKKDAFIYSSVGVLAFCVASLALYGTRGGASGDALSGYVLPAALGGMLGALLFGRIGTRLLRKLFAALLLYSGLKMMGVL